MFFLHFRHPFLAGKLSLHLEGIKGPRSIVQILREAEGAFNKSDVCRKYGIAEAILYRWCRVYAGMEGHDVRQYRLLQAENAKLKKLVAEQALANEALKEALTKRGLQ